MNFGLHHFSSPHDIPQLANHEELRNHFIDEGAAIPTTDDVTAWNREERK